MISKIIDWLFSTEDEFSKKWMEKISRVLLGMVIFTIPFFVFVLWLHVSKGLSYRVYNSTLSIYASIMKPIIVSYFVCFIGYMGKAFLSKKHEEANKLAIGNNEEDLDDEDTDPIEEGEDEV